MARPESSKSTKTPVKPPEELLLTQKAFEKELKALASKAKEETWAKWAREQAWVLAQSGILLTLAAVYSNVSELSLSPVYGGIPASIHHTKGIMTAMFLGWSSNLFIKRNLPLRPQKLLPVIAAYIPFMQYFLFKVSGSLGAVYGPLITEALTFLPLLLLSVSCTATVLDDLELSLGKWQWLSEAMPGICSFSFFKAMEYFSGNAISSSIGASFFQTRLGLQIVLTGLYSLFSPSKLLLYAIPAILHTTLFNFHVPSPYATSSLNATMNAKGWSLLERQESITGYISVLESSNDGFRVMRCDHSLLGGEWLRKRSGSMIAEPIYGVFVMLEAVRLVQIKDPVPDNQASAFVVGLGIGTTPAAFMQHGIKTTIVEIDPVVHQFATKYFALSENHTPVIQDAVSYASEMAQAGAQYDYVVHDVFTGGAEPVDLFTLEFLQDLNRILNPGGVIAINYAGDLLLPAARIIVNTIKTVFPNCRIFRESAAPSEETIKKDERDFTNMVIFCTNAGSSDSVTFRKPTEKDFLGSGARQTYLVPRHEVDDAVFETQEGDGGLLLRNATERFRGWQQQSALGHWAVMRTVLPKEIWEDW